MTKNFLFSLFLVFSSFSLSAKIYDTFMYFNEIDLLEIRLNELNDVVDYFVIVEALESFRGSHKGYRLEQHWDRIAKFQDKIRYIKLEHYDAENDWAREDWMRNQILRGLYDCEKSDLVLLSDLDEIPPREFIEPLNEAVQKELIIKLKMKVYKFFLNRLTGNDYSWNGTLAIKGSMLTLPHLNQTSYPPNHLRTYLICQNSIKEYFPEWFPDKNELTTWFGGWHFTSVGGFEKYRDKVTNYLHWRNPHPSSYQAWRNEANCQQLVEIDESFPKFVQENVPFLIERGLIDTYEPGN